MNELHLSAIGIVIVSALVALGMWGCPTYNVWQQGLSGEAALARAEQERQILVEQARAELDASGMQAEAIMIVGKAAKAYPEYRNQMFILGFTEALQKGSVQKIIFVPTEANIPITEAGRTTHNGAYTHD